MRLAIDGSHWAIPGGIRSYLENLIPALLAADPELELRVFLRGRTAAAAATLPAGAHPIRVPWPRKLLDLLERRLGRPRIERWSGPVDAVLGTHFVLPPARPRVPRVLVVHDVAYLRRPDLYADDRGNAYGYRHLLLRALTKADRVIALTHFTKQDILEVAPIDPDRIWVVPHGVDNRFRPTGLNEQAAVRRRLGLEGDFVIYPIGTITPRKNIDGTLRAFAAAFPEPGDRPTLLLTGPGELPAATRRRVAELDLSRSVRVASVGYPDELAALYSAARWGMYPSLYEGFGLPPLEGMACDLPMLVSNRTSCPEVVGKAAELVDPGSIETLAAGMRRLEDAPLRKLLRTRGRDRVSDPAYSWERCARQTLAVIADDRAAFDAEPDPLEAPATAEVAEVAETVEETVATP